MKNGSWSVGSSDAVDITISAKTVNKEHAVVKYYNEKYYVTDMNSKNKTTIIRGDNKINVVELEQLLPNDIIYIGRKKFSLSILIKLINEFEGSKIETDEDYGVDKQDVTPAMEEKVLKDEIPLIRRVRCFDCSTVLNIDYGCYLCGSNKHKERTK
ncbi:MAG: hypothetical protein DRG78_04845 [Epsilonproteobacteria bacterium]|nr:MAG: hypothetical protein DRG78_04845 [Campylobacterota bacterium]